MEQSEVLEQLDQAKAKVQKGVILKRLLENDDFREIILEGYLEKESVRLTHLIDKVDQNSRSEVYGDLRSIASFNSYLDLVESQAEESERFIEEISSNQTEYLEEE